MFLKEIRTIFVSRTQILGPQQMLCPGKRRSSCVRNIVSSFTTILSHCLPLVSSTFTPTHIFERISNSSLNECTGKYGEELSSVDECNVYSTILLFFY